MLAAITAEMLSQQLIYEMGPISFLVHGWSNKILEGEGGVRQKDVQSTSPKSNL